MAGLGIGNPLDVDNVSCVCDPMGIVSTVNKKLAEKLTPGKVNSQLAMFNLPRIEHTLDLRR